MKNQLKKIRNLLAITFLIAFSSCEKDIYEDALNSTTLKKRTITFTEFKNNTKAYKSYKKVQKVERTNFSKNLVLDSLTNFILDMDRVVEITNGNTTSYTILIEDLNEPTKVKNLVFTEKVNGEFDVFLTKYTLTEEERKRISEGEVLDLQSKTELFARSRVGDLSNPVRIDENGNCYAVDKVWEENGYVFWSTVSVPCPDGMGGGGSDSSGDSSSNGGGFWTPIPYPGTSNGGDEPTPGGGVSAAAGDADSTDFSSPVLPVASDNPCAELKAKTFQTAFQTAFNTLNNPEHFTLDHETAYVETKNGNVQGFTYLESPPGANNHIIFNLIPNLVSYIHVHNNNYFTTDSDGENVIVKTAKIPSAADLIAFLGPIQVKAHQQGMLAEKTYGMTLSSQALYCFKLKTEYNLEYLNSVNNIGIDWNNFKKESDIQTQKLLNSTTLNDAEKLEKMQTMFLEKIKNIGLNQLVGLYKGTVSVNSTTTRISWKEVTLDENNKPIEIPCN